jgi:[ribosomal protein S5]-alanine N-acetyltransferase
MAELATWRRPTAGPASATAQGRHSRRGRGYATDALATISEWALSLREVERLEAYIEPWDEPSWRAAERDGYQRKGLLRSWQRVGTERRDIYAYSRVPSDRAAL